MVKLSHLKIYFHSKIEKIFKIVGTNFMIWFKLKVVVFYGIFSRGLYNSFEAHLDFIWVGFKFRFIYIQFTLDLLTNAMSQPL